MISPESRMYSGLALALLCLVGAPTAFAAAEKNGVGLSKISLPSGPGSIEGLGDAFEPQLNTGTSTYSVKIQGPPGVNGLQPDVVLRYNSGAGNGKFGIAWKYEAMSIQRQVEKGLPTYGEGDVFTFNGEELVPLSDGSYRTENESAFMHFRREGDSWIVRDRRGTTYKLGSFPSAAEPDRRSRICRPDGNAFGDTFKWCCDEVIDTHGNRMEYRHTEFADSPGDLYCTEVRYSVFEPNYHSIHFNFVPRPDAFSSFLSGFEVRCGRRCDRIEVRSQGNLVRRYELAYELPPNDPVEVAAPNDVGLQFSRLRQVTQFDKIPGSNNFLPPTRLGYYRFDAAQGRYGTIAANPPISIGNPNIAFADINADSLPDLLYTDPLDSSHHVYYNNGDDTFLAAVAFTGFPLGLTLDNPTVQLTDYNGDGRIDLVSMISTGIDRFVYYPNTTPPVGHDESNPAWGGEVSYTGTFPPFELSDPSVRTLDLDNDKQIDFFRTTAAGFIYYYNRGTFWEEDGLYLYGEPQLGDITGADGLEFSKPGAAGPVPNELVKLADMNGDRLLDLVKIDPFFSQVSLRFWPNQGRGHWGDETIMQGDLDLGVVPIEDAFLRDINGDGLADLVAVGYDQLKFWINLGNNRWSRPDDPFNFTGTPEYIRGQTVLQQVDINGNSSTDFLWENFDASTGSFKIEYFDFIGESKPGLLKVIDNGIGLQTTIDYRTSTEYYVASSSGDNPWTTRLPFPSWCVSKITKTFGLDLDSLPGEDKYVTEYSYYNGYYDAFEKEFRGYGFAKQVERGDDRLTDGGPAPEINSPSTLTRIAFHTGTPDNIDNDGDNHTDEFDPVAGYEEEALKGKVLWTEVTLLTDEFDQLDNDGDSFFDESDEGAGSGAISADAVVFTRDINTWNLKTIHDSSGGFVESGANLPFATLDGRNVTFPFVAQAEKQIIEAVGSLHVGDPYATGPVTLRTLTEVNHFGDVTRSEQLGVVSGGDLASYDDERVTATSYAHNVPLWIVGKPTEVTVIDENGNFVSKTRTIFDKTAFGQVGPRGLRTSEERFIGTSNTAIESYSPHPGDPRAGANDRVITTFEYDAHGNPTIVRDPLYGAGPGHEREFVYDPTFHTYVVEERIDTGGPSGILAAAAQYDFGGAVITQSTDFNSNLTDYQYDSFFRVVGIVKPGDTANAPTTIFQYFPGDSVRSLEYTYDAFGNLATRVSANSPIVSRVMIRARESAEGGTFDIVHITDGAGHELGTIEEDETVAEGGPGQYVYSDVKRYTSRSHERDSFLPYFEGSPQFHDPGARDRTTNYYDALGRVVVSTHPRETIGGSRSSSRNTYLPLKTILYDGEDNSASSIHADTPHIHYKDGLYRLVRVDEVVKLTDTGEPGSLKAWSTHYVYNLQDNLIRVIDSQNNHKWIRHDGLGRMIFMEDPDRGRMYYTYDAASNLIETVDAKGQIIIFTYDGVNRILTEDYLDEGQTISFNHSFDPLYSISPTNRPDVAYFYDVPIGDLNVGDGTTDTAANTSGQLAYIWDLSGEEHLSYDERGRTAWKVKRIPDPITGLLSSFCCRDEYDSLDRLIRHHFPDSDYIDYIYNARTLPEKIKGGDSGFIVSNIDYTSSGQIGSINYGNGVSTAYSYDPRLRLHSLETESASDEKLIDYTYTFDRASNITRIDDERDLSDQPDAVNRQDTQNFLYDNLYRLTRVDYTNGTHIEYRYDRIGNMLLKSSSIADLDDNGLPVADLGTMTYGGFAGPNNRLGRDLNQPGPHALTHTDNGAVIRNYLYDGNGNMININGLDCEWDFKDRLRIAENDQMRAEYIYDHANRRTLKRVTPKNAGVNQVDAATSVLYPHRSFEVREHSAPIKYVWNKGALIVRATGILNATKRVQRLRLFAGWNIIALTVSLNNGVTQIIGGSVVEAYRYDSVSGTFHSIAPTDHLPAGTIIWVNSERETMISIQGEHSRPVEENYVAGGHWIGNFLDQPLDVAVALPTSAKIWQLDPQRQKWRNRFGGDLSEIEDRIPVLEPGGTAYLNSPLAFTLNPPPSETELLYYHENHAGSVYVVSDMAGNRVRESAYLPFGSQRVELRLVKNDTVYGFARNETDRESSLGYFGARYMEHTTGAFISPDQIMLHKSTGLKFPQALNNYRYALGNPLMNEDSSGLFANFLLKALSWFRVAGRESVRMSQENALMAERQKAIDAKRAIESRLANLGPDDGEVLSITASSSGEVDEQGLVVNYQVVTTGGERKKLNRQLQVLRRRLIKVENEYSKFGNERQNEVARIVVKEAGGDKVKKLWRLHANAYNPQKQGDPDTPVGGKGGGNYLLPRTGETLTESEKNDYEKSQEIYEHNNE